VENSFLKPGLENNYHSSLAVEEEEGEKVDVCSMCRRANSSIDLIPKSKIDVASVPKNYAFGKEIKESRLHIPGHASRRTALTAGIESRITWREEVLNCYFWDLRNW